MKTCEDCKFYENECESHSQQELIGLNRNLEPCEMFYPKQRLIDADAFIEDIKTEIMNLYLDGMKGTPRPRSELYDIIDRIGEQPTVDAVEVVHGRWIHDKVEYCSPLSDEKPIWIDVLQCSVCKEYFDMSGKTNYCPNCGANMMDGDN